MQNNPTSEKEESVEELAEKYCADNELHGEYHRAIFIAGYNAHKQRMGEVVKDAIQAGYSVLTGNETPNELDLLIRAMKMVADALPPKTT